MKLDDSSTRQIWSRPSLESTDPNYCRRGKQQFLNQQMVRSKHKNFFNCSYFSHMSIFLSSVHAIVWWALFPSHSPTSFRVNLRFLLVTIEATVTLNLRTVNFDRADNHTWIARNITNLRWYRTCKSVRFKVRRRKRSPVVNWGRYSPAKNVAIHIEMLHVGPLSNCFGQRSTKLIPW